MSRIGKKAIEIPSGVKVELKGQHVKVTGPLGSLEMDVHPRIQVKVEDSSVMVINEHEENRGEATGPEPAQEKVCRQSQIGAKKRDGDGKHTNHRQAEKGVK